jgi:hypothetical protein
MLCSLFGFQQHTYWITIGIKHKFDMKVPVTYEILEALYQKGYTILIAKNRIDCEPCLFVPVKWDVDEFISTSISDKFKDDEILIIEDALHYRHFEALGQHSVDMPSEKSVPK